MGLTVYGGGGKPEEEKTVTAGTSVIEVLPSSGKYIKKVTVNPTPSQNKTVRDTNKILTVSPDSGKLLKKVIFVPEKIETTVKNLFNNEENTYRYNSGATVGNASYATSPKNPDGSTMNKYMYDSTGSLGEVYRSPYLKPYLTNGHTYYFACWLYQTTPHGSFDFYWPISEPAVLTGVTVDVASKWVKHSTVFTRSGYTSGNTAARCDFNNPGNYGMNWNGLILVDLTAAFGAGYEPDKAWCDANIKYTTNDEEQAVTYYLP